VNLPIEQEDRKHAKAEDPQFFKKAFQGYGIGENSPYPGFQKAYPDKEDDQAEKEPP
jgi:hypothetical protein